MALDLIKNDNTLLYFLNNNARKIYRQIITDTENGVTGLATQRSVQEVMADAQNLAVLIRNTGDALSESIGALEHTMTSDYVSNSSFGELRESITTQIQAQAGLIAEYYSLTQTIQSGLTDTDADLLNYMTQMDGKIQRGYLDDPDNPGNTIFGIAISEKLEFTGSETTQDGETYYELSPLQTFGFYTSTGWQFWIGGEKRGWFDATDGMLHIKQLVIEQSLQFGDWEITVGNGFGLRYIGS